MQNGRERRREGRPDPCDHPDGVRAPPAVQIQKIGAALSNLDSAAKTFTRISGRETGYHPVVPGIDAFIYAGNRCALGRDFPTFAVASSGNGRAVPGFASGEFRITRKAHIEIAPMRLKESIEEGIDVFALQGEIDLHYAPVLRSLFQAKIKTRTPALILELSHVGYIDSTGLAAIIEYFRDAARHAGILCLVGLNQDLKSIFEMVKLNEAIPMFATVPEATAALKEGSLQAPPTSLFEGG